MTEDLFIGVAIGLLLGLLIQAGIDLLIRSEKEER